MSQFAYLFLNGVILSLPLIFTLRGMLGFSARIRHVAVAILLVATPFILWDFWATAVGHWAFNPQFVTGWYLVNLPIEEWLFFLTVPFSMLFLLYALQSLLPHRQVRVPQWVLPVLALLFAVGAWQFWEFGYTRFVFLLAFGLVLVAQVRLQATGGAIPYAQLWYLSWGFLLFFIFNTVLTATPIVTYGEQFSTGIRVGTIPIEDFAYNFVLLLGLLFAAEYVGLTTSSSHRQESIFKAGSTTYFTASLFFPAELKHEVTTLYAFVRVADNFVDSDSPSKASLTEYRDQYRAALAGKPANNPVIDDFVVLMRDREIEPAWVEAFFTAMLQDFSKKTYATIAELEAYMYGSAEVIGLMMARILMLPEHSHSSARSLGKAMQYCNFLRDIQEDQAMGRRYIPTEILRQHGLDSLDESHLREHAAEFGQLMRAEQARYLGWMREAEQGYHFIPRAPRAAIVTAAKMYTWTAAELVRNPFIVFERKVKPSKPQVIATALASLLRPS